MRTKIPWTDRTWNPVTGCTPTSRACDRCYAKRMANRLAGRHGYDKDNPFKITWHEDVIRQPLTWRTPAKVFAISMGDLFHPDVPDEWIDKVMAIITLTPKHTYQILTKRPERMLKYFSSEKEHLVDCWEAASYEMGLADKDEDCDAPACHIFNRIEREWPLKNLWLGVTAEDQKRANLRIPLLLGTPAAIRFVSIEPMLGVINLRFLNPGSFTFFNALSGTVSDLDNRSLLTPRLDWVICGGESGPKARPLYPRWVDIIRNQCYLSNTPFFFKSWGSYIDMGEAAKMFNPACRIDHTNLIPKYKVREYMKRTGVNIAFDLLDGKEYKEFPKI